MKTLRKAFTALISLLLLTVMITLIYFGVYYHAGKSAKESLHGSGAVSVTEISEGYLFDGPGNNSALVFYPGAKVEAAAYAPLMDQIAEQGTDCFLCDMPLNFALFDKDRANSIKTDDEYSYEKWFVGGHSLGGAAAAMLAEEEGKQWSGLVLLAAYPTGKIEEPILSVYGSNDGVLNMDNYKKATTNDYWPPETTELVIEGGNHALFGDYGAQKGDGNATITAAQQQKQTADAITLFISKH